MSAPLSDAADSATAPVFRESGDRDDRRARIRARFLAACIDAFDQAWQPPLEEVDGNG